MSKDNLDKKETPEEKPEDTPEEKTEETSEDTEEKTEGTDDERPEETSEEKPEEDHEQIPGEYSNDEDSTSPEDSATPETTDGTTPPSTNKMIYIGIAIVFAVILFFGIKDTIVEYFSGEEKTKAPVASPQAQDTPSIVPSNHTQALDSPSIKQQNNSVEPQQQQAPANTMTEDRVKEIVKSFILDNPEVIMESLTKFQKKAQEEQAKQQAKQQRQAKEFLNKSSGTISTGKPFLGNKDGTLNIVEFFDYQCIHCNKVSPKLVRLTRAYPNLRIALVPLPFMGAASTKAAKFSLAVNSLHPNKFSAFHSDLIKAKSINDEFIFSLISKHGLDKNKLIAAVNSDKIDALLKENLKLAQKSGVRGVPSFVINGEFIPGAASYKDFKKKIDLMIKVSN